MDKITISHLVEFNRKTPKGRRTLVEKLKKPKIKPKKSEGGGDYWISAVSCISRAFEAGNNIEIGEKIDELLEKIENSDAKITKNMFQRNIHILQKFEEFDFAQLKPKKFQLQKRSKKQSIVVLKKLPLYAKPNHVFLFEDNGVKKIGAIWFVAKLDGFTQDELSMITDILYRYLELNYSDSFEVATNFCIAFDVTTINILSYAQLGNKRIKSPLIELVNEINQYI
ncbi:hypothetical protein [Sphingobacterium multivorum]|uniref:hypothetical protein n=1 Tax=Sphingobacterium multivorum TaxID=28454 RepID=UPI0028A5C301|nr:hypothetical protein [Sphingobacterium multivorum]